MHVAACTDDESRTCPCTCRNQCVESGADKPARAPSGPGPRWPSGHLGHVCAATLIKKSGAKRSGGRLFLASATFLQSGAAARLPAGLPRFRAGLPGWQRCAASGAAPNRVRAARGAAPPAARGCLVGSAGLPRCQRRAAPMSAQRCQDVSAALPGCQRGADIGAWQRGADIGAAPAEIGAASQAASLPAGQPRTAAPRCRDASLARAHASQGGRFRGGGGHEGSRLLAGRRARAARSRVAAPSHYAVSRRAP